MYQKYSITEKTDYDAIQKARIEEGVHPGVFIPLDVQMRKAQAHNTQLEKAEDDEDIMKAATFVRKEPDGKGGWNYFYRNPGTGKVEAGQKFSAKQRFGAHKEEHEKHRKKFYAAKVQGDRDHHREAGEHHLEAARSVKKEMGKKKSLFDRNDLMKAATGMAYCGDEPKKKSKKNDTRKHQMVN